VVDLWLPGAIQDPGPNGPYPAGRNAMQFVVHHDTAGTNSVEICKNGRPGYNNGLCNLLYPKVGAPYQFQPIDALTYHAGSSADYDHDGDQDNYNPVGPGLEVERLEGESLSDDQILWLGKTCAWLEELGIPNIQYRGEQFGADDFRGHVNHRDLHPNPDGLSPEEWDTIQAVLQGTTISENEEEYEMPIMIVGTKDGKWHILRLEDGGSNECGPGVAFGLATTGVKVMKDVEPMGLLGIKINLAKANKDGKNILTKV